MRPRLHALALGAAIASLTLPVSAGQHTICFEAPPTQTQGGTVLRAIAGCLDDGGMSCGITPTGSRGWNRANGSAVLAQQVQSAGHFELFEFVGSGSGAGATLDLKVDFGGGKRTMDCKVTALGTLGTQRGAAEGVLTGFSSDALGMVSTGVWMLESAKAASTAVVPGDFVVSGGGFQADPGAFVRIADTETLANAPERGWLVRSLTDALANPAKTTAYAVGLRIHGLDSRRELLPMLRSSQPSSAGTQLQPMSVPSQRATPQPGEVVIGGGVRADADVSNHPNLWGQFATATAPHDLLAGLRCALLLNACAPEQPRSWDVESKDEAGMHPGQVTATVLALPGTVTVQGKVYEVRARMVHRTSAPGTQASAKVDGLRGEYALTQAGARTLWAAYNPGGNPATSSSRLSSVVPLPDLGGASATATHGSTASQAAVTAYAQGIKLVPLGSPPDVIERPRTAREIDMAWWCTMDGRLYETTLCKYIGKALPTSDICQAFPELKGLGYCRPEYPK